MVYFLIQQDVNLEDSIPLSKGISHLYQKQWGLWGISNHLGSKDTNTNMGIKYKFSMVIRLNFKKL